VRSALVSLSAGAAVWIVSYYFFEFEWSYLLSLLAALVGYLFVGMAGLAKNYIVSRFRAPAADQLSIDD
jgi:predicted lysophospholipase L1 biosynthesis ABC-type transport system permease subunit